MKPERLKHLNGRALVYFIQAGKKGPIKIGSSEELGQRIADLQIASPYELMLLGVISTDDVHELEQRLHKKFEKWHIRGGWFAPRKRLRTYIEVWAEDSDDVEAADPTPRFKRPVYCEPRPLITLQELASALQISEATLSRYVHAGTIPCMYIGRQIRFYPPAIYKYLHEITPMIEKLKEQYGADPFTPIETEDG